MTHRFKVIIEHNEDEGGYTVTVPALPGCITEGETVEEALENVKEAIAGFLEAMQIQGKQLPAKDSELLFGVVNNIKFLQNLSYNTSIFLVHSA